MKNFWTWLRDLNSDLVWKIYLDFQEKGPDVSVLKILAHRLLFFILKFEPNHRPKNLSEDEIPF